MGLQLLSTRTFMYLSANIVSSIFQIQQLINFKEILDGSQTLASSTVESNYFEYATKKEEIKDTMFQKGHLTPNADFSQAKQRVRLQFLFSYVAEKREGQIFLFIV